MGAYGTNVFVADGAEKISVLKTDMNGDGLWWKYLNNANNAIIHHGVSDSKDNFYFTGYINWPSLLVSTAWDAMWAKVEPDGHLAYFWVVGGTSNELLYGTAISPDENLLVVSGSSGSLTITNYVNGN